MATSDDTQSGPAGLRGSALRVALVGQVLQVLVERRVDLEAALEQRVAALLRRGAEARVVEQAVLHLGDEELLGRSSVGRQPGGQRLVVRRVGLGLRDVALIDLGLQHVGRAARSRAAGT